MNIDDNSYEFTEAMQRRFLTRIDDLSSTTLEISKTYNGESNPIAIAYQVGLITNQLLEHIDELRGLYDDINELKLTNN